jgi:hypothetical protein
MARKGFREVLADLEAAGELRRIKRRSTSARSPD